METKIILQNFKNIINAFYNQEYGINEVKHFIKNNEEYFSQMSVLDDKKVYFIYNCEKIYAVILVKGNSYWYSLYVDNEFQKIQKSVVLCDCDLENSDYIIEMILNTAISEKMKKVVPNIESMYVENKVHVLKDLGLNSNGYHIR